MKKLLVFIFITLLLCGLKANFTQSLNKLDIFANSCFEIFTNSKTEINCNKIANGKGEILFLNYNNFIDTYKQLANITGFNIYTNKANNEILKDLNAYNIIIYNDNIYAYSPIINSILSSKNINSITINNKQINMQIIKSNSQQVLGFPINLGSY